MSIFALLLFSVAALLSVISAASSAASSSRINDHFSQVLVGGGLADDNDEVWNSIIDLGGGKGVARFGVISAASDDPCCDKDSSFFYYRNQLIKYGAKEAYYIPVTINSTNYNSDPEVVAHIRTLSGFFFGGGDQLKIIRSFYNNNANITSSFHIPSPALIAIKEALMSSGGVVAGTSAGTDCLTSDIMVSGGTSYSGLKYGSKTFLEPYPSPIFDELTAYTNGIGIFPHSLLDTHFENRGRHGRMIRLLADTKGYPTGSLQALGVDENTALVVTGGWNSRVGSVIGQRGVVLMDITSAVVGTTATTTTTTADNDNGGSDWSIEGVKVSHLTHGDTINLSSFAITPAVFKTPMAGRETDAPTSSSNDIFASTEFSNGDESAAFQFNMVASSLFKSKENVAYGYTKEKNPQFKVTMSKSSSQGGYDGVDPATGQYWFSYYHMSVNLDSI